MSDALGLLFNRAYWLDEWHTMLVVNRPSLAQVIGDLRNGSDFAPPFVHVSLWVLKNLVGGELQPSMTRAYALAFTIAACWFTYSALRRTLERRSALAGALAVASHAMVVSYAFETRFYAPWLMFAAMFAWSLGISGARARVTVGAVAAIGLCTTHWFGVVTLGLMCVGAFACHPERSEGSALAVRLRRIVPALAGLVALLLCMPLLLGQRASVRERSWVQELSLGQFSHLVDVFWIALPPLLALAVIGVALAIRRSRAGATARLRGALANPSIAAMLALAAMPIALVVLSVLQPVMLDRYALTALLAWAPLVALAVGLLPRGVGVTVPVVFGVAGLAALGGQIGIERQVAAIVARDQALLADQCARGPVAFTTRLQMYYHTDFIRRACPAARYLAISNDKLERLFRGPNARVQPQFRSENEFAEMHRRMYGFPQIVGNAALDSLDHFVVMAEPTTIPRDMNGRELFSPIVFPGHRATPLNGNGVLYERVR